MLRIHAYISVSLGLTVFVVGGLGARILYRFARSTFDPTARRVWRLMAAVWGGLLLTELGLLLDRATFFGLMPFVSQQHFELSPLPDLVLVAVNVVAIFLIRDFQHGALDHLANVFREVYQLREEVALDKLTGLANRAALAKVADQAKWTHWSLLMIDIDNFKAYHDTYGHLVGDRVLELVGQSIRRCIRGADLAFRYRGEEFLVVCPQTALNDSLLIAERIRQTVAALPELPMPVTVSIGAAFADDSKTIVSSIAEADAALYQAKHQGKNQVSRPNSGV